MHASLAQEEVRLLKERSSEMADRTAKLQTRGHELEVRSVEAVPYHMSRWNALLWLVHTAALMDMTAARQSLPSPCLCLLSAANPLALTCVILT